MNLKELLIKKINNHYKDVATILNTSEWCVEQILQNNGMICLDDLQNLFNYLGIEINDNPNKKIKYELSTEINTKVFKYYVAYWLKKKKYEIRESTFANYSNILNNIVIPNLGDIPCEKFNNRLIQEFAYWCKEYGGKDKKGISEHYIRDTILLLKSIIRDGQEEKVFPEFLFKQIKIPKNQLIEQKKQIYTETEYKKIISYIMKNISSKSIGILLGIYTGMRIGEICALQWKDIDFEEKVIHVNKTVQRIYNSINKKSKIIITPGKTQNSIRNVPITNDLIEILKRLKNEDDFYIISDSKEVCEPRTYRKFYEKFMQKAGIEAIKFHSLRHGFASISVEYGIDIETIREILGHSDIAITLKNYVHTSQKAKVKAIEKFNEMLKS